LGVEEELHHIVHHPTYIIASKTILLLHHIVHHPTYKIASKWVRKTILLLHHIVHHHTYKIASKWVSKKNYFIRNAKVLTPQYNDVELKWVSKSGFHLMKF